MRLWRTDSIALMESVHKPKHTHPSHKRIATTSNNIFLLPIVHLSNEPQALASHVENFSTTKDRIYVVKGAATHYRGRTFCERIEGSSCVQAPF